MDPLSQAVLGAVLPQSLLKTRRPKFHQHGSTDPATDQIANDRQTGTGEAEGTGRGWVPLPALSLALVGALAGMAPDLDVFIRSSTDPLLFLEYHRQFTHSLIFIPIGAALCALAFWPFLRRTWSFRTIWLVALLGYGTHGLLDACTTYGTLLLWPFSQERIAWNNVSVVDPLVTLPVLLAVLWSVRSASKLPARIGLAWCLCYLLFGVVQQHRAEAAAAALAASRGHENVSVSAKPSLGNLLLWKVVYRHEGRFWVDAVRTGVDVAVIGGDDVEILDLAKHLPWLDPASQQALDLERFRWFSSDHLAVDKGNPNFVVDMRYSMLPNEIEGLWGIRLDPSASLEEHVEYVVRRDARGRVQRFIAMLVESPDAPPESLHRRSDVQPVPDATARSSGRQP